MISRRKFLKRSSETGVSIAAASVGLGAMLSKPGNSSAAGAVEVPETGRRAQQSFEIRCDSARTDSRTYNERFDGFVLSTFSGEKARVVNGELKSV